MITRERLAELAHQAAGIAAEHQDVDEQFRSFGVEPDDAIRLLEVIFESAKETGATDESQLSLAFILGILVGREQ